MKKISPIIVTGILITLLAVFSCNSKISNAEKTEKQISANNDFELFEDSIKSYLVDINRKILHYENQIEAMKADVDSKNENNKAIYRKKLNQLEKLNQDLKTEISNFKDDELEDWNLVKNEFNNDLDEIGIAIANLFEKED